MIPQRDQVECVAGFGTRFGSRSNFPDGLLFFLRGQPHCHSISHFTFPTLPLWKTKIAPFGQKLFEFLVQNYGFILMFGRNMMEVRMTVEVLGGYKSAASFWSQHSADLTNFQAIFYFCFFRSCIDTGISVKFDKISQNI